MKLFETARWRSGCKVWMKDVTRWYRLGVGDISLHRFRCLRLESSMEVKRRHRLEAARSQMEKAIEVGFLLWSHWDAKKPLIIDFCCWRPWRWMLRWQRVLMTQVSDFVFFCNFSPFKRFSDSKVLDADLQRMDRFAQELGLKMSSQEGRMAGFVAMGWWYGRFIPFLKLKAEKSLRTVDEQCEQVIEALSHVGRKPKCQTDPKCLNSLR